MKPVYFTVMVLALTMSLLGGNSLTAQSAPPPPDAEQALQTLSGGQAVIDRNPETGLVRFIGTDLDHAVAAQKSLSAGSSSADAAMQFAREYGALFGVADPDVDLSVQRVETTPEGQTYARFRQTYQGIPVLAGELIVHMDGQGRMLSMNGEALDDIQVDAQPALEAAVAQQTALALIAKQYDFSVDDLQVDEPALWVYNPRLLGGPSIPVTSLVWRMEVTAKNQEALRELVLVDAQTGGVRLHFNQVDAALSRTIYDHNNVPGQSLPGPTVARSEGGAASGVNDVNYAYDFAGQTYNFYFSRFGRDSIDGAGMALISTVRYCPNSANCPYANAFWNGEQMVYGDGFASADDVVAHELTHGVTEYTSNLFYYMQSGAINESLSDIFGEFVDQVNDTRGTDTPATKWKLGEDLPGLPNGVRNMSDPTVFGDPDKVTSADYYGGRYGSSGDNGGVHINSGILNKAAFLITDGGTFNGQTISGLGLEKAAQIFYALQVNLLTPGADYNDLYNLIPQACNSLVGSHGITSADCTQVVKAVTATEMNLTPDVYSADPTVQATCPVTDASMVSLFSDGFEAGIGNWTDAGNGWHHSPTGFNYPNTGLNEMWADDAFNTSSTTYEGMASGVILPAGTASTYYLYFAHAFDLETGFDGGVVEYSVNNGASWISMDALPVANGPSVTLSSSWGNPLGGRLAFSGVSRGYQSTRYNLTSLAGNTVRFRWRLGVDVSGYYLGWYLDDVSIYRCGVSLDNKIYVPNVLK